jgi:hypothetical protein
MKRVTDARRSALVYVLALAWATSSLVGCSDDRASDASVGGAATGAGGSAGAGQGTGASGSGAATASSSGAGGEAPLEELHLVGRFDESDAAGPRFTWPGTSIGTRLAGTAIDVELDGAAGTFFQVVVDGEPTTVFETSGGPATYAVASGLPAGEHDVQIYRRTEGFTGVVQFKGFVPARGGSVVPSPSPHAHRIEFIGDSITCGYGVEGPNAACNFTTATESAYPTYAAIAARNTSAAAHLIAYSGKGVFQNYGGDQNEPMPELYPRTLTDDPSKPWDFSKWVAEAVVINLGTNDFSAALEHDQFVGAYVELLATVRASHPDAMVFAVSWAHWGSDKEQWVLDALAQSGDANTRHVGFSIDAEDGFGCDYHPSAATHAKLGELLTAALEAELGW